jgi:uncharacterized sulfatase
MVFVIADDCTIWDIGCYGGQAHTPNIDKLATEGMQLMNCFQTAPMCSPTRHNIYTGLYPVKSGAYPNHTRADAGTKSIVQYLKPQGYRVVLAGKTHISPKDIFSFDYIAGKNPDMAKIDTMMKESVDKDQPFCLFACSNEPHSPWNKGDASRYPPDKVKLPPYIADTPEQRADFSRYLAEVTYYDGQVGEILALLDKHKLADNTLVMVVSEQGNAFPFAKWTCYDAGLRSAMIVRWPGVVKPGSKSDAMVEYTDVCPTFVEAGGGTPDPVLDGKSMLPVLRGETNKHKNFVYGIMTTTGIINGTPEGYPIRSVRSDKYKLIRNLNHTATFRNACTKQKSFQSWITAGEAGDKQAAALAARYQKRPAIELYDITKDPLELNNLAANPEYSDVIKSLDVKLTAWMTEQGDKGLETEANAKQHQGGRGGGKKKNDINKKKKKK